MTFDNLKIKNIDSVVRYRATHKEFESRNKPSSIMGLKLSGDAEHVFADKQFRLKTGDVYFLNQYEDYRVREYETGIAFSVHFSTTSPVETESFCIPAVKTDDFMRKLVRIEKYAASRSDENLLMSEVYAFASMISALFKRTYSPKDERMEKAVRYIRENFREKDCLDSAAKVCGLTRRRFNDLFKKHMGQTPNRYITGVKTEYARSLLETGYITVSEAAEMSGFSDVYYFSRVFRQELGVSPGSFKSGLF